ncbi:MAG: NfeD family protein [Candidatus Rariloculaceae bacterium]
MRLSKQKFWLLLGIETVSLVALAVWILWQIDRLFAPVSILVALGIIVAGDVVSALLLQHYAPTRITLRPGEEHHPHAEVVSGFGESRNGEVTIKGERWQARSDDDGSLRPGDRVGVVARDGLTLRVRSLDP